MSSAGGWRTVAAEETGVLLPAPPFRCLPLANECGTPGGVGTNTVLRVTEHSFRDIAQNFNQQAQDVVLVETPDTTPPVPLNARIHYGTGVVMFNTSEILDVTPTTVLELTLLALRNDATTTLERDRQFGFQTSDVIDLTGSTITAYDDTRTVFQLTELQRVHALAFSGTKGADRAGHSVQATSRWTIVSLWTRLWFNACIRAEVTNWTLLACGDDCSCLCIRVRSSIALERLCA